MEALNWVFHWVTAVIFIYTSNAAAATSTTSTARASTTATCWYPDKSTQAVSDRPCNNGDDGFSTCCAADNLCLTNGYCLEADLIVGRGSCTDQSWSDAACPQQCRDGTPHGGGLLVQCNPGASILTYACDGLENCNSSNFSLPSYNYILRDYQVEALGLSSAVTITTSVASTASTAAASTNATSSNALSLPSLPPAESATCTADGALQAALHAEQHKVVAVGAGVGVPLGVLFLSFVVLFLLERQKNRKVGDDQAKYEPGGDVPQSRFAADAKTLQPR